MARRTDARVTPGGKPAKPDPKLMDPPYGERAQRIMRRVMGGS